MAQESLLCTAGAQNPYILLGYEVHSTILYHQGITENEPIY